MIYDPYSREMQHDPYPAYRHFRDHEPCTYNERLDFYALFRFEDVWEGSLDWQGFSSRLGHNLANRTEEHNTTACNNAFFGCCSCRVKRIFKKVFALLHLCFGCGSGFDDGYSAG